MNNLICKFQNIPIAEISKLKYSSRIKLPPKATNFDFVSLKNKAGRQFDIITFHAPKCFDGFCSTIRKYIFENSNWGESVTQQDYIPIETEIINDPKNGRNIPVKGRKIKSVRSFNDKIVKQTEQTQTVTMPIDANPILHISKIQSEFLKNDFENERQSLYKYEKNVLPKGYEIHTSAKSPYGYMLGVIPVNYRFKDFSEDKQEKLKNDKYMLLHLYSLQQFKKMAPTISENSERPVKFSCKVKWYSDSNTANKGKFVGNVDNINHKSINLNRNALTNRYDIVAKSAHEREHAYQFEQIVSLEKQKEAQDDYVMNPTQENLEKYKLICEKMPVKSRVDAERYRDGFASYVDSQTDVEEYSAQELERLARSAELIAEREYRTSVENLKSEFPYAPSYLIAGGDKPPETLAHMDIFEYMRLNKK